MTGICGWFGRSEGDADAHLAAMSRRISSTAASPSLRGPGFGVAAVGPEETACVLASGPVNVALFGHALWRENGSFIALSPREACTRIVGAYRDRGATVLQSLGGDFAVAIVDTAHEKALIAIDRMGVRNLVYRAMPGRVIFAANLDALAAHPDVQAGVDAQGIYNYVYFHMVPGPGTILEGCRRLPPGHLLETGADTPAPKPYWHVAFVEDDRAGVAERKDEFRATLREGVAAFSAGVPCGTFLSGGTDSSTVTGVLAGLAGEPVETYSIGFDAAGYDEMHYARIAAQRFGTRHHEYYVTPDDVVTAVDVVASEYDQPFGNASAVPTYFCARLAASTGTKRMLAGDGGDELFGGNARYARQHLFTLYDRLPAPMRTRLIEPIVGTGALRSVPLLRKAQSYVEQASTPMPARYEAHNLLERIGPANVFAPEFLASVDRGMPLTLLRGVYDGADAQSPLNRMLALDFRFTLADSDLPKVVRMCDRAGVDVAFPLLHERVVDFSARLSPAMKLKGTRLRPFFKEALRGFLPDEIIAKQKHGFGLPAGVWLESHPPLNALARDAMASLAARRIFRAEFLDALVARHLGEHPAYYGTMLWVLTMLELWFRKRAAARG